MRKHQRQAVDTKRATISVQRGRPRPATGTFTHANQCRTRKEQRRPDTVVLLGSIPSLYRWDAINGSQS